MTDMLVKLYNLPESLPAFPLLEATGVKLRKPLACEKSLVVGWVREHFDGVWADETEIALTRLPVACYIAQQDRTVVGFACYDASALGFFGPTGVQESFQGKGIGKALLIACLLEMKLKGYGYAIIGGVGPQEFYRKAAGAAVIPESTPGIWMDFLGEMEE